MRVGGGATSQREGVRPEGCFPSGPGRINSDERACRRAQLVNGAHCSSSSAVRPTMCFDSIRSLRRRKFRLQFFRREEPTLDRARRGCELASVSLRRCKRQRSPGALPLRDCAHVQLRRHARTVCKSTLVELRNPPAAAWLESHHSHLQVVRSIVRFERGYKQLHFWRGQEVEFGLIWGQKQCFCEALEI